MSVRGERCSRPQGLNSGKAGAEASREQRAWTRSDRLIPWSVVVTEHPVGREDGLSLMAVGVFARVCALKPGTVFDAVSLAAASSETPAEIGAALGELAAVGYLAEVTR